jgi:hypothetical protein
MSYPDSNTSVSGENCDLYMGKDGYLHDLLSVDELVKIKE